MKLKVNPTRMELLKLRKRMNLAKRGHKLLKDKEEQLLLEFRELVNKVRNARKKTEHSLQEFYITTLELKGLLDEKQWREITLGPYENTSFDMQHSKIFNIPVSRVLFKAFPENPPANYSAPPSYNSLMQRGRDVLLELLELSFLENKLVSFAYEIERTRRRVNALEHVLIPNLEETIKFITFKLNENERTSLVILKHIQLTKQ